MQNMLNKQVKMFYNRALGYCEEKGVKCRIYFTCINMQITGSNEGDHRERENL